MKVLDFGLMPYQLCLERQIKIHQEVVDGKQDTLIFVEHPPVLTLGRNANEKFITASREQLKALAIDVVTIDRGGEVTGHFPGQLVMYPILNLQKRNLGVKDYVLLLENALIQTCAAYNVKAMTRPGFPGVWIDKRKIAAIGIRIKNHCTMHGIALNISNNLAYFQLFTPCGITDGTVTSIELETEKNLDFGEVKKCLLTIFCKVLESM